MTCIFVLITSLGTFKRKVGKYTQVKQKHHPRLQEDGRLGKTHAQHILRYHGGDPSIGSHLLLLEIAVWLGY